MAISDSSIGSSFPNAAQRELVRPQHHTARRKPIKVIALERKAQAERRMMKNAEYTNKLNDIKRNIWSHAIQLASQFPKHNTMYHYQKIMSHSRYHTKKRKISRWHAFMSKETKQSNAGKQTYVNLSTRLNNEKSYWMELISRKPRMYRATPQSSGMP